MALFKCKMCGGDLELHDNQSVATCEYCGTQQTLPKLSDDRRANLYDRANHFRRNNDFDKAMGIYNQILNDDTTDAEAYWSLVLCRYGIEYVEDPVSRKRVPTVNRAQFTSIFADEDYKSAIANADTAQKTVYEAEAKAIDEIQKEILAISQKEEPFDVFICYKETDNNGRRTPDSVLANDLYHQLTQEGFKVFFARITLEDKLGTAYEPYIFAALNSAKVMVALGTKPDYFKAVWVKNEWSRYLALIKQGQKKMLIPAYKDMDPYDLPEEFSHLQAQDMSKLGFMQDLIRGIKKLATKDEPKPAVKETVVVQQETNSNVTALLKRGYMALEDKEWEKADDFFEQVLNQDAENAEAYLGKFLCKQKNPSLAEYKSACLQRGYGCNTHSYTAVTPNEEHIKKIYDEKPQYLKVELSKVKEFYQFNGDYDSPVSAIRKLLEIEKKYWEGKDMTRAQKFARGTFADELKAAKNAILAHFNELIRKQEEADRKVEAELVEKYKAFEKDADKKVLDFYKKCSADHFSELCKNLNNANSIRYLREVRGMFEALGDYPGAKERIKQVDEKIVQFEEDAKQKTAEAQEKAAQDARRAKKKKIVLIVTAIAACLVIAFLVVLTNVIIPNGKYDDAVALMNAGKYDEAISAFETLNGYKDSNAKIVECNTAILDGEYNNALALMNEGKYEEAIAAFEALDGYKDSKEQITVCNYEPKYRSAEGLLDEGKKYEAAVAFAKIKEYSDAGERSKQIWGEIIQPEIISAGDEATLGVKANGKAIAVGLNNYGRCDVSDWGDIVSISSTFKHTVGLKADGTVVITENDCECNVSKWTDIVSVSAGYDHIVGLRSNGEVIATGGDSNGECLVSDWTDIVAIDAGWWCTVGLKRDGTVVRTTETGDYEFYKIEGDLSNWTDIIAISAGKNHIVGLKSNGTVVAIGENLQGQCNVSGWRDIVAISAGGQHTVGLKKDGTVVATLDTTDFDHGQSDVSGWNDIVAISAGSFHTIGLKRDGTVVATKIKQGASAFRLDFGQCDVSSWSDIKLPQKQ